MIGLDIFHLERNRFQQEKKQLSLEKPLGQFAVSMDDLILITITTISLSVPTVLSLTIQVIFRRPSAAEH
jgi:hypothetical protein